MNEVLLILIGLVCLALAFIAFRSLFYPLGRLFWCSVLMVYLTYEWWSGDLAGGWVVAAGIISLIFVLSPATIFAFFAAAYLTRAILKKQ